MKPIGLIGGMSWESTVSYYEAMNRLVRTRKGGLHSLPVYMASVDFAPYARMQKEGAWDEIGRQLNQEALRLEQAGAKAIVLATNTMHAVADEIASGLSIPFLHIGDAAAKKIASGGLQTVGLLGTSFTMEQPFYHERLNENGIQTLIPSEKDRAFIHDAIFTELCMGVLEHDTKQRFLAIMEKLRQDGAEGIVLGCTEIPLLIKEGDTDMPLFNTPEIHAEEAVTFATADPF